MIIESEAVFREDTEMSILEEGVHNDDMLEVAYDDLLEEDILSSMYILLIDGMEVQLPTSKCDIDYMDNCIAVPRWLVEDRGLEAYVTNDDAYI